MTCHHGPGSALARAARKRIVDRLDGSAGNAEHVLDTSLLEARDDQLRNFDLDQLAQGRRSDDVVFRNCGEGRKFRIHVACETGSTRTLDNLVKWKNSHTPLQPLGLSA